MNSAVTATPDLKLRLLRLHFFYVAFILSAALILLATRDWTGLPGFTDYLSVAATITSLVLGVLAIIYSFVTSNSTNNFLGSVESSTRDVKLIGAELQTVLSKGQDLQSKAEQRNDELHSLIGSLRSTVEALTTNTTSIAGTVETLPGKLDSLRSELLERASRDSSSLRSTSTQDELSVSPLKLQDFLSQSSSIGLTALRALCIASQLDRAAALGPLFKTEFSDSYDYAHGFLICASCFGLADFEVDSKNKVIHKIQLPDDLPTLVEAEWSKRKASGSDTSKASIRKYEALLEAVVADEPAK